MTLVLVQTIAGHRLVRLLARGTGSEVWLGSVDADTPPVAVKLFHPATPLDRIDAEVEALGRASHRHVQRLIDVAIDPHGRTCLVLERLSVSLARVLADRGTVSAGEAVTVLAPLCDALKELHRVGVAHRRLGTDSVLLDDSGAPVLARFGAAALVGDFPRPPQGSSLTPAEQAENATLRADRDALARFAEQVLQRAPGAESVLTWVARRSDTPPGFAAELADRLYALAPAAPLAVPSEPVSRSVAPLAIRPESVSLDPPQVESPETQSAGAIRSLLPPWLDERVDAWRARLRREWLAEGWLRDAVGWMRAAATGVRPRVWLVAAGGLAALLLALLLAGTGAPGGAEAEASPGEVGAVPGPTGLGTAPDETLPDNALPDDPVEAARVLLEHREQCFRQLSVLCLDASHQRDSAALEADRRAIIAQQQGSASTQTEWGEHLAPAAAQLSLLDLLGDGALIGAAAPSMDDAAPAPEASTLLLLVRTDDGWRIRDIIEPVATN